LKREELATPAAKAKQNVLVAMRRAACLLCMALLVVHGIVGLGSCANMGTPDGGWYDDTPPYVVRSTPQDQSTNIRAHKVTIYFNEYIKLSDAQNKVIVSPPQLEMPDIKEGGKRIVVDLKDSLKDNTTYTIDFGDAISDNNEDNPMGNYTFSFSTGDHIDTLEVSGYVLDASNLEPIKDVMVGLHRDLSDSVFTRQPMIRISRTDSRGHFTIKGVAPGTYRAYALKDADGDYLYNQRSEMVAFNHTTFEPSWKPDTRQDTIWRDSLHINNIVLTPYTHFLPDDITLMAFTAKATDRYLLKTERKQPNRLDFYFSNGADSLPTLRGLNFDEKGAFVVEHSLKRDTVFFWLKDTALVNQDTLHIEARYLITDTAGVLYSHVDTLEMASKVPYAKRLKEQEKEMEKWLKEQEKKKKRGEHYDSVMPAKQLSVKLSSTNIAPDQRVTLTSETPLRRLTADMVHLYSKVDSLWYTKPLELVSRQGNLHTYDVLAEWEPGGEYSLEVDSAVISDIYGTASPAIKQGLKVGTNDTYGTIAMTIAGVRDTGLVVQLVNNNEGVVKQTRLTKGSNTAYFFYLKPGTFYMRAYIDANGNNEWDTGDYDLLQQPERVYYYPKPLEVKQKWDLKLSWSVEALSPYEQKPAAIVKQKPEQQKKLRNRNAERARQKGIEYIEGKTGVKLK